MAHSFPGHAILVSFDAIAMFTNINVVQSITFLHQKLLDAGLLGPTALQFKELLKLCCKKNYCSFRGATFLNEIERYIHGRYISASETMWRIFKFHIHERYPSVRL